MKLINQIEAAIWDNFSSYKNVKNYIKKWHFSDNYYENFTIIFRDANNKEIDLSETLHNIDGETLIKIAIDLGIETPDYIPAVPVIKNVLKTGGYSMAFNTFQKAMKQVEEDSDLAVGSANSALESIIKHILENDDILMKYNKKNTLYDLGQCILKEFSLFPNNKIPEEIRNIGSGLLNITQNIEKLRSEKTTVHGKTKRDYIITDPLYAYFIINAISTLGLFLINFYENKYNKANLAKSDDPELAIEDISL